MAANGKNIFDFTTANFDDQVIRSAEPVLIDFTAAWCAPCRAIAPSVDAVAEAYVGRLRVGKLDVDASPQIAERYGVRSMPTLLLFKGGQVIGQLVGAVPKRKIEELVEKGL
jgi:thioredoxin 1